MYTKKKYTEDKIHFISASFVTYLLIIGVFFSVGTLSFQAHGEEVDKEQEEEYKDNLKKQEKLLKKKESYENIIQLKQSQAKTLDTQISSLENRSKSLEEDISENQQELSSIEGDMQSLNERIQKEDHAIHIQKEILAGLIQSFYDWGQYEKYGPLLFDEQFSVAFDGTEQVQGEVRITLNNIIELKKSLEDDRSILETEKKKVVNLQEKLEQQNVYLESSKAQKATLLAQTKTEASTYQRKLSKVEEELRDIEQEIEEIESIKSGNLDYGDLPSARKGYLKYPIKNYTISQNYGKTSFTRWYTFHNGTDFAAPTGTKIYAPRDGKVVGVGNNGRYAYGKWVAVDHGDGLVTMYGHMSSQSVKKGEKVDEGDTLGKVGNTGYSTGPHLHFTVFSADTFEIVDSKSVNGLKIPTGAHVNPMRYLGN